MNVVSKLSYFLSLSLCYILRSSNTDIRVRVCILCSASIRGISTLSICMLHSNELNTQTICRRCLL